MAKIAYKITVLYTVKKKLQFWKRKNISKMSTYLSSWGKKGIVYELFMKICELFLIQTLVG